MSQPRHGVGFPGRACRPSGARGGSDFARRIWRSLQLLCPLALFTALGVAPVTAHQEHDEDPRGELVEAGVLTVGIALTGRPFAYRRDGALRGFEIDLAAEVARSRGLELELVQLPRRRLAEALAVGEVDLVNTFALKGGAPPGVATIPYLVVGDYMMVLKANPFRIRGAEDLAGHTVSATAGSSAEAFAYEINRRLIDQGREAMHIHSFPNQRDTHFPVTMGHAAAYFIQSRSALVPTLDPESRVRLFEGVFRPRREVGFGVRADDRDLRSAIERAVAAKVANGTYDALRAKHAIPDDLSPFR